MVMSGHNVRQNVGALEDAGVPNDLLEPFRTYASSATGMKPRWESTNRLPGGENYRELLITLPLQYTPIDYSEYDRQAIVVDDAQREVERARGLQYSSAPGWKAALEAAVENLTVAKVELVRIKDRLDKIVEADRATDFRTSHWLGIANVVVHVRYDERTDANGKRTLLLNEIQSDWHQAGWKRGYAGTETTEQRSLMDERAKLAERVADIKQRRLRETGAGEADYVAAMERITEINEQLGQPYGDTRVPDAPFKTTWPELALKRMIRYAADNGYDQIAWTTGAQQVEINTNEVRARVDVIKWETDGDGRHIEAYKEGDRSYRFTVDEKGIITSGLQGSVGKTIEDVVGKAIAEQIMGKNTGFIEGDNLVIGGRFHTDLYDKRLVNAANKIGRKFGVQVGKAEIDTSTSPIIPEQDTPFDVFDANGRLVGAYTDESFVNDLGAELGGRYEMQSGLPPGFTINGSDETWHVRRNGFALSTHETYANAQAFIREYERAEARNKDRNQKLVAVHALPITPAMAETVRGGQPLFSIRPTSEQRRQLLDRLLETEAKWGFHRSWWTSTAGRPDGRLRRRIRRPAHRRYRHRRHRRQGQSRRPAFNRSAHPLPRHRADVVCR
jgi:hypothetical protein